MTFPAQAGQPHRFPPVREAILAHQTCPCSQIHQTFFLLPCVTSYGVSVPFKVGCHWAAISGIQVNKSLNPLSTLRIAQYGQPQAAWVRVRTGVFREWPFSHCHQTQRLLYRVTISGVRGAFFSMSHCAAILGNWLVRSFSLGTTFFPAQAGHPAPLCARETTIACQAWPWAHCHHTFLRDPATTSKGVSAPFLDRCHWAANAGWVTAKLFSDGMILRLEQTGQPHPCTRDLTIVRQI